MQIGKSFIVVTAALGVSAPAFAADWSGFHVGVDGGYGGGHQAQHGGFQVLPAGGAPAAGGGVPAAPAAPVALADGGYGLSGGLVGVSVGYDLQRGPIVFGLAADGSFADISGGGTCGFGGANPHGCGGAIRSLGTVRGRVGFDVSSFLPSFSGLLLFGSGGLAIADVHAKDALLTTSGARTLAGWTAGGGLAYRLAPHWAVTLEYLHVDLGDRGLFSALPPSVERVRTTAEIARIGVDYYFDAAAPAPIIARY